MRMYCALLISFHWLEQVIVGVTNVTKLIIVHGIGLIRSHHFHMTIPHRTVALPLYESV